MFFVFSPYTSITHTLCFVQNKSLFSSENYDFQPKYSRYVSSPMQYMCFIGELNIVLTSSLPIRMSSVTSVKTVGCMKYPSVPCRPPPHASLAPSFFPLSIRPRILLNCSSSIWNFKNVREFSDTNRIAFEHFCLVFTVHQDSSLILR